MSIAGNITNEADGSDDEVKDRAKEEIRSAKLDNDIKQQDKNERKIYAELIFTLITIWLLFVLIIFVAIGKGFLLYSDSVIITLLTTTTIEVIGVFLIVARYLFRVK